MPSVPSSRIAAAASPLVHAASSSAPEWSKTVAAVSVGAVELLELTPASEVTLLAALARPVSTFAILRDVIRSTCARALRFATVLHLFPTPNGIQRAMLMANFLFFSIPRRGRVTVNFSKTICPLRVNSRRSTAEEKAQACLRILQTLPGDIFFYFSFATF
jgi:hypothetical protein